MLTETKTISQISVTEQNTVQVRESLRVFRDGEQIAETYHRFVIAPGDDISNQDPKVQAVCQAVWG